MKNRILFVNRQRKVEIDALRMQAYAKASGFSVDLTTLKWALSDDESFVMAAETEGQLIATMRGEVVTEVSLLEQKLECPWDFPLKLDMPILLLSRAATLSSYRSAGLNLILRYWFLRFAITHNINFVLGTFVTGSPRENTLREMGYQFFDNKLGWQKSTYRSLFPVTVVALDIRTQGKKALRYCLDHAPNGMNEYVFDEEFPDLRIIKNL
ncbi:MAG: hypothetical protein KIT56_00520 [Gammaproteobacteria bacterium]|nr:hypothetical protein [Gammaproteobacteria bacterium]MCW5582370.1 hypothetical protein [Gammaproteobacteria bacterium]